MIFWSFLLLKGHGRQPLMSPIITFTKLDHYEGYRLDLYPVKWQGNILLFKRVIRYSYEYGPLRFWELETQAEDSVT